MAETLVRCLGRDTEGVCDLSPRSAPVQGPRDSGALPASSGFERAGLGADRVEGGEASFVSHPIKIP